MPVEGYRDVTPSDGTQMTYSWSEINSISGNMTEYSVDMGGGHVCWRAFSTWGWYFFICLFALVMPMQIRWINRGTKHYGCDVVAPCEIVTNVLIADFCCIFIHSEIFWFDYNLFVRQDRDLYYPFIGLYAAGNFLGVLALLVLAFTPRSDDYAVADKPILRLADHYTRHEGEDTHVYSSWHWITPAQV